MMSLVVPLVLGASAGVLLGYAWGRADCLRRVREATEAVRDLEHGKLGRTLPERGPRALRILAGSLNGVSANFQEILLLFAHHVRHLRESIEAAEPAGTQASRRDLLDELSEMDQVLHDFDYYRVRIEGDMITDTGPPRGQRPAETAATAARAGLAASSPTRALGGSYDE